MGGNIMFDSYPDVLKTSDVQRMLHIGKKSVYDLIHSKRIHAKKIGKNYRISKESVVHFIQQQ